MRFITLIFFALLSSVALSAPPRKATHTAAAVKLDTTVEALATELTAAEDLVPVEHSYHKGYRPYKPKFYKKPYKKFPKYRYPKKKFYKFPKYKYPRKKHYFHKRHH
ncbi:hypothetical protein BWQ96_09896 [Gracilariopsis chorda]|uniref:Uncharacterized protein n=1 Tax=Gracilariopsis chorda TaxID=448386 RepID=A0A2V3IE69_9FLOR|nr:hypothetical protein BWQ96_09896 [Gracilariopsis chorda]|eukprot:PXF40389.1 hypothetical protein BWQ96_09896 [Gracilariopsis chorda]